MSIDRIIVLAVIIAMTLIQIVMMYLTVWRPARLTTARMYGSNPFRPSSRRPARPLAVLLAVNRIII